MKEAKKEYIGVMLNDGDFYVVVTCQDCGEKRITCVVCPFQSNKLGFVDLLDHSLKLAGYKGVVSYTADSDLTNIVIDDNGADMSKLVRMVDSLLSVLNYKHAGDVTDDMARAMRQFVLATQRNAKISGEHDFEQLCKNLEQKCWAVLSKSGHITEQGRELYSEQQSPAT